MQNIIYIYIYIYINSHNQYKLCISSYWVEYNENNLRNLEINYDKYSLCLFIFPAKSNISHLFSNSRGIVAFTHKKSLNITKVVTYLISSFIKHFNYLMEQYNNWRRKNEMNRENCSRSKSINCCHGCNDNKPDEMNILRRCSGENIFGCSR